jgi:DNA-binding CsgD family transcriptional regulator
MISNRIPGGIIGGTTEFFKVLEGTREYLKCFFGGKAFDFLDMPVCRKDIMKSRFDNLPIKQKEVYTSLSSSFNTNPVEQMTMCLFGALNSEPDISEDGNLSAPEYVPCIHRGGGCKFEGIGCCSILISEGVFLSRAETEVFKLVEFPDKLIADKLFLSIFTVQKHFKNIRMKTGFNDKLEMAVWAAKKGII